MYVIIVALLQEDLAWVVTHLITCLSDKRMYLLGIFSGTQVLIRAEKRGDYPWVHPHKKEFDQARGTEKDQDQIVTSPLHDFNDEENDGYG